MWRAAGAIQAVASGACTSYLELAGKRNIPKLRLCPECPKPDMRTQVDYGWNAAISDMNAWTQGTVAKQIRGLAGADPGGADQPRFTKSCLTCRWKLGIKPSTLLLNNRITT